MVIVKRLFKVYRSSSSQVSNTKRSKMQDEYLGLSDEAFERLTERYETFTMTCDDPTVEPISVFSPLTKKGLNELYLIREVSLDLQKKKEEDMKKAAQAAEEAQETEGKTEETEGAEEKAESEQNDEEKKAESEK